MRKSIVAKYVKHFTNKKNKMLKNVNYFLKNDEIYVHFMELIF